MKRFRVEIRPYAQRQYAVARAWWRVNRPAARGLLGQEFREAVRLLRSQPEAGILDEDQAGEIRRVLLRRTGYHVFYTVDRETRRVVILALWHAQRLPPTP